MKVLLLLNDIIKNDRIVTRLVPIGYLTISTSTFKNPSILKVVIEEELAVYYTIKYAVRLDSHPFFLVVAVMVAILIHRSGRGPSSTGRSLCEPQNTSRLTSRLTATINYLCCKRCASRTALMHQDSQGPDCQGPTSNQSYREPRSIPRE